MLAIIVPEFGENQHGTVHFDALVHRGGGLVTVGEGFDAHLSQLAEAIGTPQTNTKPFVSDFVRPLGLDQAATPVFVEAVEAMRGIRVEAVAHDALAPIWRWMLRRIAALRDRPRFERWTLSPREHASAERLRLLRHQKAIRRAMSRAERRRRPAAKTAGARSARLETDRQERQRGADTRLPLGGKPQRCRQASDYGEKGLRPHWFQGQLRQHQIGDARHCGSPGFASSTGRRRVRTCSTASGR